MFLSAVTTCQREHRGQYLVDTISSLHDVGFCPMLIEDGGSSISEYGHAIRLGIVPTFRTALASRIKPACELGESHVAVFQDDIEVHPEIIPYLKATLPSGPGVFSLFLSEGRTAPEGWSQLPDDGQYPLNIGACGLLIDVETARQIIDSEPFPRVDRLGSQLALWCRRRGIPFWLHSPSLIRHVGEVSVNGNIQVVGNPAQLEEALPYPANRRDAPAAT